MQTMHVKIVVDIVCLNDEKTDLNSCGFPAGDKVHLIHKKLTTYVYIKNPKVKVPINV